VPIFVADEQVAVQVDTAEVGSIARHVLASEGYPESAELSIILVSVDEIAGYNARFMGREGPTDVLAFPLEQFAPGRVPALEPDGPPLTLGDVVIAPEEIERQAADLGVAFQDELSLMVVHGILHLLGWDHQNDAEADAMEQREAGLLGALGVTRR
jgi:probable rRNA maturation factor